MDWTPFQTNIAVPVSFEGLRYQCLYITRTLFDCDPDNIEYLYTAPLGSNSLKLFIMRTDGTQLFEEDSAFCEYCFGSCLGGEDWVKPIVNTSSGAKLFIIRYNHQGVQIYSLCGSVPTDIIDYTNINTSYVTIFPNPSSSSVTFDINPPDNAREYDLVILDNQSKVLSRKKIGIGDYHFQMDLKDYSSGEYFYSFCTKDKSYQSGKFILNK